MADFSTQGGLQVAESAGIVSADTGGTAITANATANTKGSYTELIASTSYHTSFVTVTIIYADDATAADYLVDIAIGAASSEVVIIPNLLFTKAGTTATNISRQQTYHYSFPIEIASGTRISARVQCTTGSEAIDVSMQLFGQSLMPSSAGSRVVAMGATTADSGGTQVTAGTSNSKGSYTQLTASSDHIKGFVLAMGWRNIDFAANIRLQIDVAIGSAASEKIILPDWMLMLNEAEMINNPTSPFIPLEIPSGSRVSIRVQQNSTNSRGNIDYIIYGVV